MTDTAPQVPIESFQESAPPKKSSFVKNTMIGIIILVILSEVGYLTYNNFFKQKEDLSGPSFFELSTAEDQQTDIQINDPEIIIDDNPPQNTSSSHDGLNQEKTALLSQYLTDYSKEYSEAYISISNQGIITAKGFPNDQSTRSKEDGYFIFLDVGDSEDYYFSLTSRQLISVPIVNSDSTSYSNVTEIPIGTRVRINSRYYLKSEDEANDRITIILMDD